MKAPADRNNMTVNRKKHSALAIKIYIILQKALINDK